ncbi:MAG TPA: ankyrin repeat domain-containing protein [Burkholderiales bacterium]|nr:ankyrin repeat domain-containing protein [Burkholderiales bacterium]
MSAMINTQLKTDAKRFVPRRNWVVCALVVTLVLFAGGVAFATASSDLRLVEAVKNKDTREARTLLQQHVDANAHEADGATALMWAAHWDDLDTATLLIRAGANANAANDHGVTSLSLACTNANAPMVKKLLDAGANPNVADLGGETPLMTCSRTGSADAVSALLAHGADVSAKENARGQTALMWAAAGGHSAAVAALIAHHADVHARSKGGFTPLLFAAQNGDVDTAKLLLAAGVDVNEPTPEYGSPLDLAAASEHEALSLFLLEKGADPNVADIYGITPLHYSVQNGIRALTGYSYDGNRPAPPNMPELLKALLAHGANPNARIKKTIFVLPTRTTAASMVGATPFFLAAVASDADSMRVLADHGANPMLTNNGNVTPLMVAASGGAREDERNEEQEKQAFEAVKLAVQLGNDVNAASVLGQTAMHAAAGAGSDEMVQFLFDKGAKLDVRDRAGQSPWSMAMGISTTVDNAFIARYRKSTVELLVKLGAHELSPKDVDAQPTFYKYNVDTQANDEVPEQ